MQSKKYECKLVQLFWKAVWKFLKMLNFWPAVPLLEKFILKKFIMEEYKIFFLQ